MKLAKGFTLVELIIVIIISSVILAALSPLFKAGFNAFFTQRGITDANWQGRLALERMSRDMRSIASSTNITTASASQFIFVDNSNVTITYQLSGSNLMLNSNVLADGINALNFAYYDGNGAVTSTIANIRYVKIILTTTKNNTNTVLQTVVNLRNILP